MPLLQRDTYLRTKASCTSQVYLGILTFATGPYVHPPTRTHPRTLKPKLTPTTVFGSTQLPTIHCKTSSTPGIPTISPSSQRSTGRCSSETCACVVSLQATSQISSNSLPLFKGSLVCSFALALWGQPAKSQSLPGPASGSKVGLIHPAPILDIYPQRRSTRSTQAPTNASL